MKHAVQHSTASRLTALGAMGALALSLAACGGGGSDSGSGNTSSYNIRAPWLSLTTGTVQRTLTTTFQGQTFTLGIRYAPGAGTNYPPSTVLAREQRETLTLIGPNVQQTGINRVYFNASTGDVLGQVDDSGDVSVCSSVTTIGAPPEYAAVGNSGLVASGSVLASCTAGAAATGSFSIRWSLETMAGGGVGWCLTSSSTLPDEATTDKRCFQIATNGALGPAATVDVSTTSAGQTTTLNFTTP